MTQYSSVKSNTSNWSTSNNELTFYAKSDNPHDFRRACESLIDILADYSDEIISYGASPADGSIRVDSDYLNWCSELERRLFMWKMSN